MIIVDALQAVWAHPGARAMWALTIFQILIARQGIKSSYILAKRHPRMLGNMPETWRQFLKVMFFTMALFDFVFTFAALKVGGVI